jgi:hypothetical protein
VPGYKVGHTHRSLAAGNEVSKDTCRRYIAEGITLLARRAVSLSEVVRLAAAAGWPYLIVDGVNVPTERLADKKWFRVNTSAVAATFRWSGPGRGAAVGLRSATRCHP